MNVDKLLVEFDVEKTIEKPYGYQEKIIKYRDSATRYKAIIKDGKLVAIQSRGYKLIMHEQIDEILDGMIKRSDVYGWRKYWLIERGDIGVLVCNAIDGSMALRVVAILPAIGSVLVSSKVQTIYRKHTVNMKVEQLREVIGSILDVAEKYKHWLVKLDKIKAKDNIQILKGLIELIPKKYVEADIKLIEHGTLGNGERTLKQFYECVSRKIWNANTDMVSKFRFFKALNDVMFSIVEFED